MCVDYTNLNWACPKDSYPLLVNKSVGCKLLSFTNAHFDYNQVLMRKEDEGKTTFFFEYGTFCQ